LLNAPAGAVLGESELRSRSDGVRRSLQKGGGRIDEPSRPADEANLIRVRVGAIKRHGDFRALTGSPKICLNT
jgi:hypothetical protein